MPKVNSLGHVGVYVRDIESSVAFYRDILGMQVSDRSPRGGVFMTAQDRAVEHHELLLAPGRNDDGKVNLLQQISFRCATLKDVKDFYKVFVDNHVPNDRVAKARRVPKARRCGPMFPTLSTLSPRRGNSPFAMASPVTRSKSSAEFMFPNRFSANIEACSAPSRLDGKV